jgi:hypothetical protein
MDKIVHREASKPLLFVKYIIRVVLVRIMKGRGCGHVSGMQAKI